VTSFRQIEANRRNALRSTGPITEAGKHRSRRNAVRHGLCTETVVGSLEDLEDYKGFEAAIIADTRRRSNANWYYDWRRYCGANAARRRSKPPCWIFRKRSYGITVDCRADARISGFWGGRAFDQCNETDANGGDDDLNLKTSGPGDSLLDPARVLSLCFQRLVNFDGEVFERLGRYESAIARQIVQVLFLLRSVRRC
jgi:hypothetical protein